MLLSIVHSFIHALFVCCFPFGIRCRVLSSCLYMMCACVHVCVSHIVLGSQHTKNNMNQRGLHQIVCTNLCNHWALLCQQLCCMDLHDAALATQRVMYLHLGGRKVCSSHMSNISQSLGRLQGGLKQASYHGTSCSSAVLGRDFRVPWQLACPNPPPAIFLGSG